MLTTIRVVPIPFVRSKCFIISRPESKFVADATLPDLVPPKIPLSIPKHLAEAYFNELGRTDQLAQWSVCRLMEAFKKDPQLVKTNFRQLNCRHEYLKSYHFFTCWDGEGTKKQVMESFQKYQQGTPRSLEGIPVSVKDHVDFLGGIPHTRGSYFWQSDPNSLNADNSNLMTELKNRGAICIGTTHMCEFGYKLDT